MNYFMRDFRFHEPPPVDFPVARLLLSAMLKALAIFVVMFPMAYAGYAWWLGL